MAPASPTRFSWQDAYDDATSENVNFRLFKRLEVAESTIRIRLDALGQQDGHDIERNAILQALASLMNLKVDRLGFIPPRESL